MQSINFWAVVVAAVVNMVVGMLWYGPVFGKLWKSLMGFTDEGMRKMPLTPMQAMSGGVVTSLLMAYVLARFSMLAGAAGVSGAFQLAFWVWLGFTATVAAGGFLWEGKPFQLFVLNVAEQLVALFLMALVLVFWQ